MTGSNAYLLKSLSLGNAQHGEVGDVGRGKGGRMRGQRGLTGDLRIHLQKKKTTHTGQTEGIGDVN